MSAAPVEARRPTAAEVRIVLQALVRQRQELRRSQGDSASLEANRLAIVYWQTALSHALVAERSGG